ncbi:hypothetical protein [Tellurirhabdus bombi]|uniref:hypothetical protein n=1 Tax=Tellurirhabdus bombi TaxID=2907205 RepID=UPI001F18CD5B|nr:hypothetical protein [Tellurirhabdus bombi]
MKWGKLFLITSIIGLAHPVAMAQIYMTDINGQVLRENKYVDVQGSPYLDEAWKPGLLISSKGKAYPNSQVRFDAYGGEVEYQQNEKTFRMNPRELREFKILSGSDTLRFKNGFAATNGNTPATYYQVLYDGSVKLLKQLKISMNESKAYNSATTTKTFAKQELYFINKSDGSLRRIQRNRKSVLSAFPDKKSELEKASKEFNASDEAGLVNLIAVADQGAK